MSGVRCGWRWCCYCALYVVLPPFWEFAICVEEEQDVAGCTCCPSVELPSSSPRGADDGGASSPSNFSSRIRASSINYYDFPRSTRLRAAYEVVI